MILTYVIIGLFTTGVILSNTGPNVFVTEHKLGISMSILKPMFAYVVPELYHLRSLLHDGCSDDVVHRTRNVSLAALLVKGDFPPALDTRKLLIMRNDIAAEDEKVDIAGSFGVSKCSDGAAYCPHSRSQLVREKKRIDLLWRHVEIAAYNKRHLVVG